MIDRRQFFLQIKKSSSVKELTNDTFESQKAILK